MKATKIEITRGEGPSAECGKPRVFTSDEYPDVWERADITLSNWAFTAPGPGGGYDKCDFTVTWEDGETYTGRFDLKKEHMVKGDLLAEHISGYLTFLTGDSCPSHMKEADYLEYIAAGGKEGIDAAKNFLSTYKIGDYVYERS